MDDLKTTDNPEASTPDLAELGARNCSTVYPHDLAKQGGEWLAECRRWIQRNIINGDSVTWGSEEPIRCGVSVKQLEDLSAHIAAKVMNDLSNTQDEPVAQKNKDQN